MPFSSLSLFSDRSPHCPPSSSLFPGPITHPRGDRRRKGRGEVGISPTHSLFPSPLPISGSNSLFSLGVFSFCSVPSSLFLLSSLLMGFSAWGRVRHCLWGKKSTPVLSFRFPLLCNAILFGVSRFIFFYQDSGK